MMESAHSLLLNEDVLAKLPDAKRAVFVFEWLQFLDRVLSAAQRSDVKDSQQRLVAQLTKQVDDGPGPPTRALLARCLASLFAVGDASHLFETVNKCNDVVKNKDDSPSFLPTKLTAVTCLGALYEKLGRMVGRSFEETVGLLIKALKNAESQGRFEVMVALQKVVAGLGSVGSTIHKDVYKACSKLFTDRAMSVRCAAARCMAQLVKDAPFVVQTEVDNVASLCFRALDGSNYDVRCDVARLLGLLLSSALKHRPFGGGSGRPSAAAAAAAAASRPVMRPDEALGLLAAGFLKAGRASAAVELVKGVSTINREVRVGVTHAYVEFVRCMGNAWLERHLGELLQHVAQLAASSRSASSTHVDVVYARRCITFIIASVVGSMLGESGQISAARELALIVRKDMDASASLDADHVSHTSGTAAICCLQGIGSIVTDLGTAALQLVSDPTADVRDPLLSAVVHQSTPVRLAAAWALRCLAVAVPSLLCPLIERCSEALDKMKASPEAVTGYGFVLAALVGGVRCCPLGIPHATGKKLFNVAEDMLRSATQNGRVSLEKTQSGWLILGALMTLGAASVRQHLPRLLSLWKSAFPRTAKELETEKSRGDSFTWQVAVEGRACALACMHALVVSCPELVTPDVVKRLLVPLECALILLLQMPQIVKAYGVHLQASFATLRLRVYSVFCALPPDGFESAHKGLFRELVAEITLTDSAANTTSSLLRSLCHTDDSIILGAWLHETDHMEVEDQLQPNSACGSGALEHDPTALYLQTDSEAAGAAGPLPLGVAVIDAAVRVYAATFTRVSDKHRLQVLQHFRECIRQAKGTRQQAVHLNVFTAVLCALKTCSDDKKDLGSADVRAAILSLIQESLVSSSVVLRCAAGEALGRLAQCSNDPKFVAETVQSSFEKLKSARDVVTRTGHSLVLGCLHRHVGGMTSGQHLNASVSILLALANDSSSPVVQVWAIHALGLIADSGGPMFRGYAEPALALVLGLLLSVPPSNTDVHQSLGRCLAALITAIGPELQGTGAAMAELRQACLVCCSVMQDHSDSLVQAQAVTCLQELHMFAPRYVNLHSLVPQLCHCLSSSHLLLRRAAVACLRQLVQREAAEVSSCALKLFDAGGGGSALDSPSAVAASRSSADGGGGRAQLATDAGLEGALFSMLDMETDACIRKDIHDTLLTMLLSLAGDNLTQWFRLVKNVLASTSSPGEAGSAEADRVTDSERDRTGPATANGSDAEEDDEELEAQFKAGGDGAEKRAGLSPKWPTRVFAVACMRRIIQICSSVPSHVDLSLARELRQAKQKGDYLVLHLSELVRVAFIAATSESDKLRLAGLELLQDVIGTYAAVKEPEFPDHVILEQYQAQVSAALRPAFAMDTPSDITAMACDACSAWIKSGVARDLNDLRRVHQLLTTSLGKLKHRGASGGGGTANGSTGGSSRGSAVYSESASAMEQLAVLKAWAEVYVEAIRLDDIAKQHVDKTTAAATTSSSSSDSSLLRLVEPELGSLWRLWLAVLRDHALLSIPAELSSRLPPEGGTFYTNETRDVTRAYYKSVWPSCLCACTLYLQQTSGFENHQPLRRSAGKGDSAEPPANASAAAAATARTTAEKLGDERPSETFFLLLGVCVEALCSRTSVQSNGTIVMCLRAVAVLLSSRLPRSWLTSDPGLTREILNVLHRLLLTRDGDAAIERLALDVVRLVVSGVKESLDGGRVAATCTDDGQADTGRSGGLASSTKDDVVAGQSVVFASLEVILCVLTRHLPGLNPNASPALAAAAASRRVVASADRSTDESLASALALLGDLPQLCSESGLKEARPILFFLVTGALVELAVDKAPSPAAAATPSSSAAVTTALQVLKTLCLSLRDSDGGGCSADDTALLQSAVSTVLQARLSDRGMNASVLVLALAVFLSACPPDAVLAPSLQPAILGAFVESWKQEATQSRLTVARAAASVFQLPCKDVVHPLIRSLAPLVIEYLFGFAERAPAGEDELALARQCVQLLLVLLAVADASHRANLMAMLVTVLLSWVVAEDGDRPKPTSPLSRQLAADGLDAITQAGVAHPEPFRTVMTSAPQLKSRLEAAVKMSQAARSQPGGGKADLSTGGGTAAGGGAPSKPQIQLKMDFSNFGK